MRKRGRSKRGKKGLERELLKLIVGVIVLIILFYVASRLISPLLFSTTAREQAKSQLSSFADFLESLEVDQTRIFLLESPRGWHLISFDAGSTTFGDFKKPADLFGNNAVCMVGREAAVKKRTYICRAIAKPLKQDDKLVNLKIEIMDLYVTNLEEEYTISKTRPTIQAAKLSEREKQEVLVVKGYIGENYQNAIEKAAKSCVEENKIEDIVSEDDFREIVKSMIVKESSGIADAVGDYGELGLTQLMPPIAELQTLKIWYDPQGSLEKAKERGWWTKEAMEHLEDYAKILKEKVKAGELTSEQEERLDPEKNIKAGGCYLASLTKNLKDVWLALAAYNAGESAVEENCDIKIGIASCKDFEGKQYVSRVRAYYELT